MEEQKYAISKEQRQSFYAFIERAYSQLGRRLTKAEFDIRELRREIGNMRGGPFDIYETDKFDFLLREYFPHENVSPLDRAINRQFANKIYKPLALSTAIASSVLTISLGIVATPLLSAPFALVALFSLYYWHLQGEKG
jgi:hypothetical protein